MAAEREPIEISDKPELLRLVEEMEASGQPCVLRRDGKDVAVLRPANVSEEPLPMSPDKNPFAAITGLFESDKSDDVSSNKHKYLAEGYLEKHITR
jgi:hypothetical protein